MAGEGRSPRNIGEMRAKAVAFLGLLSLAPAASAAPAIHERPARLRSKVVLVTQSSRGVPANDESALFAISADGDDVLFASSADNLVPHDTNKGYDLFVRHLASGRTERVSVRGRHHQMGPLEQGPDAMSANGRFVAFTAFRTVRDFSEDGNVDLFVRDLKRNRTISVDERLGARPSQVAGVAPSLSWDGSRLAFISNGVTRDDRNGWEDAYVWNRERDKFRLVSVPDDGGHANSDTVNVTITPSGGCVAMESWANNLDPRTHWTEPTQYPYIHDVAHGGTRALMPVPTDRGPRHSPFDPVTDSTGRYFSFSSDPKLVPNHQHHTDDLYRKTFAHAPIKRISRLDGPVDIGFYSMSGNGRRFAFSFARDERWWIGYRDLKTDKAKDLVRLSDSGNVVRLSLDGSEVAFSSYDDDLVPRDRDNTTDVYALHVAKPQSWPLIDPSRGCGVPLRPRSRY